ncbi:MAG TPA: tRNA lysidine(34) synthetase TilS [Rectinemataceae bacterium]|nr:tRNA lysidine(34) synthetase TilS [Rectinemataceae bacterium]
MKYARAKGRVEACLLEFLVSHSVPAEERLCVAYSGGPDSTALLAAAAAVCPRPPLAAHVDHGLRPEAEIEAELSLVRASCSNLGAGLRIAHLGRGSVERLARESGAGVEAAARELRYRALGGLMRRAGLHRILFAHTRDDLAEGLLMRLLSGSGSGGLRGIPPMRGAVLRPFLGLGKADLLGYLGERGLAFSTDSSNASMGFLRNRVRSRLVPLLDQDFPGWRRGLAGTARRAGEEAEALEAAALALCPAFVPSLGGGLEADERAFGSAPLALRLRSLVDALGRVAGSSRASMPMARAALRALEGGATVYRGGGIEVSLAEGRIRVAPEPGYGLDFPRIDGYFVVVDRPRRIRVGALIVEASWTTGAGSGIRADAFRFPLVIRSRRPGDAIAIPGGEKRLDELFSDWGLPPRLRGVVPIAEDRHGIVAVLGAAFGAKDRYRTGSGPEGPGRRRLSVVVKGA